jgi:hypothetical protein
MNIERFKKIINELDKVRKGELDLRSLSEETLKA